jgi:isopentenyl diphosphate isomerase/L-lactate dehydrogenase-like FMN-dependent dehydrogenase
VLLKGILHPNDAEQALACGVDGLIVSNHSGRQIDGTVPALDALPAVCRAVRSRVPVLMDSGVRRGSDIIKALALGDLDISMGNAGVRTVKDIDRALLPAALGPT